MREESSWWSRNWWWSVPGGCVGCVGLVVALMVSCGVGVVGLAGSSFRSAEPVQEALELAGANGYVVLALGAPLELGWVPQGTFNVTPTSGDIDVSMALKGPKGDGRLFVVATKEAGDWRLERAEVALEDQAERIDLLASDGHLPLQ
jgi:hypothetical protein